jgi:hypothetical protein
MSWSAESSCSRLSRPSAARRITSSTIRGPSSGRGSKWPGCTRAG